MENYDNKGKKEMKKGEYIKRGKMKRRKNYESLNVE